MATWTSIPSKSWQDTHNLGNMSTPKVFPDFLCLAWLYPKFEDEKTFSFVETFAGQAEATRMFRMAHHRSARLDLLYMNAESGHQNPMDLLTDSGFVILGSNWLWSI